MVGQHSLALTPLGRRDACTLQTGDNSIAYGHFLLKLAFGHSSKVLGQVDNELLG